MNDNWGKMPGVHESGLISTADINFAQEVRKLCEDNVCRNYGSCWACPPGAGTVEECKARCREFSKAWVFSGKYQLEDSFDYEGMQAGHREFKAMCDRIGERAQAELPRFLLLSNEGCLRCAKCTYPDAPCRFPDKLYPALEGYGIWVSELAAKCNTKYINGKNTVTFFGMLMYD